MTCVGSQIGSLDPRCNFSMDGGELSKTDITTIYHWIHGQITAVKGFGFLKIRSIGKRPDLGNADFITLEGDSPKLWNLYETALRKYEFGGVGIGWPVLSETGRRPAAHHIYFDSRKLKGRAKDYFLITSDGVPPNVTSISQTRNPAEFNRALQAVKAEYLSTNPTIGDEIRNSDISASDVFKGFESLLWGGAALVGGILLYSVWQSFRPAAQAISTRASRIIEG